MTGPITAGLAATAQYVALPADDLARVDTCVAYTKGYEAGLTAATQTTTELEMVAGGYSTDQQARADALHAAARVLAAAVGERLGLPLAPSAGWDLITDEIAGLILRLAHPLATYIEHDTKTAAVDRNTETPTK